MINLEGECSKGVKARFNSRPLRRKSNDPFVKAVGTPHVVAMSFMRHANVSDASTHRNLEARQMAGATALLP
jgi:hypothetical protein